MTQKTIGDIGMVSDGWLQEFSHRCRTELADDSLTPVRRAFVEDAADRIADEMHRRGIVARTAEIIAFRPRKPAPKSIDDLWPYPESEDRE